MIYVRSAAANAARAESGRATRRDGATGKREESRGCDEGKFRAAH